MGTAGPAMASHTESGDRSAISGLSHTLLDVTFTDESNGWEVGALGTIVKTADGGSTWSIQESGASTSLHDAFFLNARTGWAIGDAGAILRTLDGAARGPRRSSRQPRYSAVPTSLTPQQAGL